VKIPKTSGIYSIVCEDNQRAYVGSAINLHKRWNDHRSALRAGRHHNKHLQRAWDKHGEARFTFTVLETIVSHGLVAAEQRWIDDRAKDTDLFNVCPTAGNTLGMRHTPESIAKMSAAQSGKTISAETRKKMSDVRRGRPLTMEQRQAITKRQTGKPLSESTKAKLRQANLGKILEPAHAEKLAAANRGERNRNAKLSVDAVRAIRTDERPIADIAAQFGVTARNVFMIRARLTWKSVP
jgi:group I intron endonuclease